MATVVTAGLPESSTGISRPGRDGETARASLFVTELQRDCACKLRRMEKPVPGMTRDWLPF